MALPSNLKYIVVVIGIALAFFYYPPPTPSPLLTEWRESGTYFNYKSYNIFYKGRHCTFLAKRYDARCNVFRFVDVKGTRTETNDKRTLLLLHGFPTSSVDWYKVLPELQNKFDRIIAPDFLGLGYSDKPVKFFNFIFSAMSGIQILFH